MALSTATYLTTLLTVKALPSLIDFVFDATDLLHALVARSAELSNVELGDADSYLDKAYRNIRRLIPPQLASALSQHDKTRAWLSRVFLTQSDPILRNRASKFTGCRRNYMVAGNDEGDLILIPYTCSSSLCPSCAAQKSADYLYRVIHHFHSLPFAKRLRSLDLRFMTLTVQNVQFGKLRSAIPHLLFAFRQFRRSPHSPWSNKVNGYLWNLEITCNLKTHSWHPHIHVLTDGAYWPQTDLDATWKRFSATRNFLAHADIRKAKPRPTSPDESTFDPQDPDSLLGVLLEITKYSLAPIQHRDIPSNQVVELFQAIHNKRLRGTAGTLRVPPVPEPPPTWSLLGGLGRTLDDSESWFWSDRDDQDALVDLLFRDRARLVELARTYSLVAALLRADDPSKDDTNAERSLQVDDP